MYIVSLLKYNVINNLVLIHREKYHPYSDPIDDSIVEFYYKLMPLTAKEEVGVPYSRLRTPEKESMVEHKWFDSFHMAQWCPYNVLLAMLCQGLKQSSSIDTWLLLHTQRIYNYEGGAWFDQETLFDVLTTLEDLGVVDIATTGAEDIAIRYRFQELTRIKLKKTGFFKDFVKDDPSEKERNIAKNLKRLKKIEYLVTVMEKEIYNEVVINEDH